MEKSITAEQIEKTMKEKFPLPSGESCDHIGQSIEVCLHCSAPIKCSKCGERIQFDWWSTKFEEKFAFLLKREKEFDERLQLLIQQEKLAEFFLSLKKEIRLEKEGSLRGAYRKIQELVEAKIEDEERS